MRFPMSIKMGRIFCVLRRRYEGGVLQARKRRRRLCEWRGLNSYHVKKEMPSFIALGFMVK